MKRILFISAFFCATQMLAQNQPWAQEPSSFLGIRFGQPLNVSVQECPRHPDPYGIVKYYSYEAAGPCFEKYADSGYIQSLPPFFDIYAFEINGKVESISAKFNNGNSANLSGTDANGIATALKNKYGNEHFRDSKTLHTGAGVKYEDQVLIWKGKNVEIDFDSVSGEYNHGGVSAYTSIYVGQAAQQQKQTQRAVEGVL